MSRFPRHLLVTQTKYTKRLFRSRSAIGSSSPCASTRPPKRCRSHIPGKSFEVRPCEASVFMQGHRHISPVKYVNWWHKEHVWLACLLLGASPDRRPGADFVISPVVFITHAHIHVPGSVHTFCNRSGHSYILNWSSGASDNPVRDYTPSTGSRVMRTLGLVVLLDTPGTSTSSVQ
ncbi:hypothetical protein VTO42DRAFT_2676 [Malbranchea cinnamomea]